MNSNDVRFVFARQRDASIDTISQNNRDRSIQTEVSIVTPDCNQITKHIKELNLFFKENSEQLIDAVVKYFK